MSKINFSDNQIQDIIDSYLHGESSVSIGKRYSTTHKPILKVLHKNNIDVNRTLSTRKYTLDETFFDNIDSKDKAYILGLFYADGNNNPKKQTVSISLQEEDGYLLERIRQIIKSTKQLEYLDYTNKHDFGYNYKNQYRLLLFSKKICTALTNIGMVKNKSLVLTFPNIPDKYHKDFIRGYFDGDGSFCIHYTKTNKFQPLITFTSTEAVCLSIQKILIQNLNISGGNIYDASCHNGVTKVLSFSGAVQTKSILDWLYADSNLYLERKYQKYLSAFYNAA